MVAVTYTSFRQNLKEHMRSVRDSADVLLVTNNDESENIVVLNARDYEVLMETVRIYDNPYLYEKLKRGIAQVEEGKTTVRELIDA